MSEKAPDDLGQALFRVLHDAGVSFESSVVIPRLTDAVHACGFIHRGRLQEAMAELLKPTESGRYAEAGYNDHFNDGVSAVDVLIDDWQA